MRRAKDRWSTRRRRRLAQAALVVVAVLIAVVVLQVIVTQVETIDIDLSFGAFSALVHRMAALNLTHLLAIYGYWAVLVFVAIESTGIPFPGETMLLAAAIYAGTTHRLAIPIVIAAAAAGAILGDNLGFWVGREGGYRLWRRYGKYVRLDERKLKLGLYLFQRHGGKVVFFGRFVAVLRVWAAFLAGTYRLPWPRFLLFNAAGGILWATLYGLGGYVLGQSIQTFKGPAGIGMAVLATLVLIVSGLALRRNERRLADEAERALPGPLDAHQHGSMHAPVSRAHLAEEAPRTPPTPPAAPGATPERSEDAPHAPEVGAVRGADAASRSLTAAARPCQARGDRRRYTRD